MNSINFRAWCPEKSNMYEIADLGGEVLTPQGIGRYLRRKNGKVLVVMDWDCPPVEYGGDEVYIKEGQTHD
jgi:hypothetical protein